MRNTIQLTDISMIDNTNNPCGLQAGAEVNVATPEGVTALHVAVQCGHSACAQVLLKDVNVDVNAKNAVSGPAVILSHVFVIFTGN